jgi:hypothetical protein
MKKIILYKEGDSMYSLQQRLLRCNVFLNDLPKLRGSGKDPYRFSAFRTYITFNRNIDAMVFRLKFGL